MTIDLKQRYTKEISASGEWGIFDNQDGKSVIHYLNEFQADILLKHLNLAQQKAPEQDADKYKTVPLDHPVTSEMKASCIGEFSFDTEEPEYDEDECEYTGEMYYRKNIVPWDTCKQIYKAMLKAAPALTQRPAAHDMDVVNQTRGDLCDRCGFHFVVPPDGCLNCDKLLAAPPSEVMEAFKYMEDNDLILVMMNFKTGFTYHTDKSIDLTGKIQEAAQNRANQAGDV